MEPEASPTPATKNSRKKALIIFGLLAVGILIASLAFTGFKWRTQLDEQKQGRESVELQVEALKQRIAELEKAKTSTNSSTAALDKTKPSAKDIIEIDKALLAQCNSNGSNNIYLAATASGKQVSKIDSTFFTGTGANQTPAFYDSTAVVGLSCRESSSPDEATGGFISILQRQVDLSWKQVMGTQDTIPCAQVNELRIPSRVIKECYEGDSLKKNTN